MSFEINFLMFEIEVVYKIENYVFEFSAQLALYFVFHICDLNMHHTLRAICNIQRAKF